MKTTILTLNQTPYENGKASGEYFKSVLNPEILKDTPLKKRPELKEKCIHMMHRLQKEYPDYYDETIGKADGLGMDRIEYFSIMCPELFNFGFEHCTTIITKKENGHFVLSHNEDDNYIEQNFCLSKVYTDEQNWFMTNDMFNMPFGNGISYNSHGIIKTINYTHEEDVHPDELPRYYGQRHISEASSLDDLIERCKEMKTGSGFHVTAIDTNTLKAISVEVYPDSISIIPVENWYVHTNHYIHNQHKDNPKTDKGSNSIFRLHKALELIQDAEKTVDSIKQILNYRSSENRFDNSILQTTDDPYITLFNFTVDTETLDYVLLDVNVTHEQLRLDYKKQR
ncbi:MAG: hypothetical protein IKU28_05615 [Erysipelotrichaceae bacterium]|nr:hypothetical protein [Erysipelotrichaceae bacterium]